MLKSVAILSMNLASLGQRGQPAALQPASECSAWRHFGIRSGARAQQLLVDGMWAHAHTFGSRYCSTELMDEKKSLKRTLMMCKILPNIRGTRRYKGRCPLGA
jgi:ferredoxin-thioredoxin reductase catalytic subunit